MLQLRVAVLVLFRLAPNHLMTLRVWLYKMWTSPQTCKSVATWWQSFSYKQLIVTSYYCYCPQINDECLILLMKLPQRNKNAIKKKRVVCYLLQFTSWCQFLLLRTETVKRLASRLMSILHWLVVVLYWLMVWGIWKRDMCLHSCGLKVLRKWVWGIKNFCAL